MSTQDERTDLVSTTITSFQILELIKERNGISVTDVATELDLAKSTAHRHLHTLAAYGFTTKTNDQYSLGPRFVEFSILAEPQNVINTLFDILELIKRRDGATRGEITEALDLTDSTTEQCLCLLVERGFIVRRGNAYRIGLRFLDFGIYARKSLEFYDIAKKQADMLSTEAGEKVQLVGIEGGLGVLLYRAMGDHPLKTSERVGNRQPLHQLASGKAILAALPEKRVTDIIDQHGLPPRTANTITDREELFEELERTRERGFGINREESIVGLNAVGAAIKDENGEPIGALSISGPANRLTGDLLTEELANLLLAATNEADINLKYS